MTLSGATIPGQSGAENDSNEGVLYIPQRSNITGSSPSDCLMSYPGQSLQGSLTHQQGYVPCILQPQPIGKPTFVVYLMS